MTTMLLPKLLVGVAATLLLANETVQQAAIKSTARVWLAAKGGVEDLLARCRGAAAEIRAEQEAQPQQKLPSTPEDEAHDAP
jgi:hypothetical protein